MPEMSTLDAFFGRVDGSVSLPAAKCSLNSEQKNKKTSRKRNRENDSNVTQLPNKKQKPLDSNLNISDDSTDKINDDREVDSRYNSDCQSCRDAANDATAAAVPSSAVEISYEDFLTSSGIVHVESSLSSCSNSTGADADVENEIETSPVKSSPKCSTVENGLVMQSTKTKEEEDRSGANVLSDGAEIAASKDIRSFFSKADKVSPQVSAATLMKIKVEVYCQRSLNDVVPKASTVESQFKTGGDLARRQRAAIVITDDDLDIEVIDVEENDSDVVVEDDVGEIATSGLHTEESASHSEVENVPCGEVPLSASEGKKSLDHDTVLVETDLPVIKSVEGGRRLMLRINKLEEQIVKADASASGEAVSCSQHLDDDDEVAEVCGTIDSDALGTVGENEGEVDCDSSSAVLSPLANVLDGSSDTEHASKFRKVGHFWDMCIVYCTVSVNFVMMILIY